MKMLGWTMTIAGAAVLAVWLLVTVTPVQADTPSGLIALIGAALLNGTSMPRFDVVLEILDLLGLSFDELMRRADADLSANRRSD